MGMYSFIAGFAPRMPLERQAFIGIRAVVRRVKHNRPFSMYIRNLFCMINLKVLNYIGMRLLTNFPAFVPRNLAISALVVFQLFDSDMVERESLVTE
jgi:hypothetical protein